jgi:cholesterol transport system auxiliary component
MIRALPLLLLLAGCGPLVKIGGNTPRPAALFTLSATPPEAVPADLAPIDMSKAITIDLPTLPGALQTVRIPVTVSDTSIQYMQEAQWAEQPNRLFQRLLADILVHSGLPVIDQRSSGQSARQRLTGQLTSFGVDVRGSPQVRVRYDATLSGPDGIRQRRFEREAPVASVNGDTVANALNIAANRVAADVAAWARGAG